MFNNNNEKNTYKRVKEEIAHIIKNEHFDLYYVVGKKKMFQAISNHGCNAALGQFLQVGNFGGALFLIVYRHYFAG